MVERALHGAPQGTSPSAGASVGGGSPTGVFDGGGAMGELLRAVDWSKTALGPVSAWPQSLITSLSLCVHSKFPTVIYWGPNVATFYNDGYIPILGSKHPWAIGRPIQEVWAEIWDAIKDMIDGVVSTGVATWSEDQVLYMHRKGYREECYFTWSFAPIMVESGATGGLYCAVTETTRRVVGERRLRMLRELGQAAACTRSLDRGCEEACRVLGANAADVPLALIYLMEPDGLTARLAGASGIEPEQPWSPRVIRWSDEPSPWPLQRVAQSGVEAEVTELAIPLEGRSGAEVLGTALVLPLARAVGAARLYGFLVVGVSPLRALDDDYRSFFHMANEQVTAAISNALAYEEERTRTESLAELDRAKTTFFSNISHEFRTPLTLILGPLEEALASPERALRGERLGSAYRSALRLLELVNSVLDFSRVEAGRLHSSFEPIDLSVLTGGLAGSFQSLVESAGMKLTVDCPPLPEPVWVDRTHWEKIVLNLVSNAFKYTLAGEIGIHLRGVGDHVELSVTDTGIGIPPSDLSKIFERFYRVEGAHGRSFEGTGIGLALVHELVKAHHGSVRAESAVGRGSTFVVDIPLGRDHLPQSRVRPATSPEPTARAVSSAVLAASQWVRSPVRESLAQDPHTPRVREARRILVADDSADMRRYLYGLLEPYWEVDLVQDGQAALESATVSPPDLVLSDVMMPRMDGITLLRALRADPKTHSVPVVLLSARSGEEAVLGGLETGADDYLAKPFSARELVARVRTHLEMARVRREAAEAANELAETRAALLGELERKNNELESFSYSVSHDLRAPIRSIEMFSQLLLDHHAGGLDPKGQDCLHRVRAATQRMHQLTDDILRLSQVERAELVRERVDLSAVAHRVADTIKKTDPARGVEFVVASGVLAHADPRLVQIVMENLLGNAWKFTGRTPNPRIEFGAIVEGPTARYFVRDNGAGFDPALAGRLFAPFQRLHSDKDFRGTGIGLATVRRIVERHGGRVWAEAAVGAGATFFWTLSRPVGSSRPPP